MSDLKDDLTNRGRIYALAFALGLACVAVLAIAATLCGDEVPEFRTERQAPVTRITPAEDSRDTELRGTLDAHEAEVAELRREIELLKSERSAAAKALQSPARLDSRPVVRVYVRGLNEPRGSCLPCDRLRDAEATLPMRLDWLSGDDIPAWVEGFPTLHWQDARGVWRKQVGFRSAAEFLIAYAASSPVPSAAIAQYAGPTDKIQQFLGASGTITIAPDQPVKATLDDGTSISYTRISGRYTTSGGAQRFTIDQPQPHIDTKKFGIHFGAALQAVEFTPPSTATAVTSAGRFKIAINPESP